MSQKGFTLIELAIALMVIGLLIGGVLKGQELIENAKITATIRQFKSYDTAAMIFRNTYNALPGDIRQPNRIPNCTAATCNTPGNGNALYDTDTEIFNFFPHLTKAGMIQGPEGGTAAEMAAANAFNYNEQAQKFFAEAPIGHFYNMETGNPITSRQRTYFFFVTKPKQAIFLDQKMDDGKPLLGSVVVESCDILGAGADPNAYTYNAASTITDCLLWIDLNI